MPSIGSIAALAAVIMAAGLLVGCADNGPLDPVPATPTSHPDITITFSSPGSSAQMPNPDEITPTAAKQLCDMLKPEVDRWRTEGAQLGKLGFNGTVHDWAARNGGLNDTVLKDRAIVDRITTTECPDIRQKVLDALDISTLADGLAGFGR
ncbi:hypothetical protein [Nocardia anaemiae]|uniref:hypothetical protein n=1 Tax=Nocardia anaemiae TaxID=263910 RepID=UPI0007A446D1|nr:hypothetical protein [Nocardia anaemiae]